MATVSNDLIWQLTQNNSSFVVRRRANGGFEFSRDPLNLTGKPSKTESGLANNRAIGISVENGRVQIRTKNSKNTNKPSKSIISHTFKPHTSARKLAKAASKIASGYRDDLRSSAVIKASTLGRSEKPKKSYPKKVRN